MTVSRGTTGAVAAALLVFGLCRPGECGGQASGAATFGTTVVIPSGLRGFVYYLRPGEAWLPDFSRLKTAGVIYTTSLNVPPQDFSLGFPGISNRYEWFAIDYTGRFWIQTPGEYQFSLTSDDGSKLYIDERRLIDLDGMHPPETQFARIKLDCGLHYIRVSYFQGPRFQVALLLSVSGGGKKWRIFSTEEFKPPPNPEEWNCGGSSVPYDPHRRALSEVVRRQTPTSFEAQAMEALNAHPRPQDFDVRSAAFSFWQSAAGSQTSIVVGVPGTGLSGRLDRATGVNRVSVTVLALVKAADGRIVEKYSVVAPYEIPDADYAAIRTHDLVFSHPVHLAPGRYTIETAVIDLEGRRTGTSETVVDSPPPRVGIGLSSLVPVDRVEAVTGNADAADPLIFEGKRVVPHLAPAVDAAGKPVIYLVVYPDSANAAKPTMRVQFFSAGALIAEKTNDLPAADASGAIPMFIAPATRPGEAELKVTVVQGADSATGSFRYRVTAN